MIGFYKIIRQEINKPIEIQPIGSKLNLSYRYVCLPEEGLAIFPQSMLMRR